MIGKVARTNPVYDEPFFRVNKAIIAPACAGTTPRAAGASHPCSMLPYTSGSLALSWTIS